MEEAPSLTPARTWIFQANPKLYDIDKALASLPEMSWSVNQYKQSIHPGDSVFLWKSGSEAGILATATVLTEPAIGDQEGLEFAVQPEKFDKPGLRVRLRIDEVFPVPLWRDVLIARMPDLSILQSPQGTNFAVSDEEALVIRELLASPDEGEDEIPGGALPSQSNSPGVWVYAPGESARFWEEFYREGIIAIEWDKLGDLRGYPDQKAIAQSLIEAYRSKSYPRNNSLACFDFAYSMRPGDQIFVKRGRDEVVGFGIIVGDYEYRPERAAFQSVRKVRWERRGNWKSRRPFAQKTLTEITELRDTVGYLTELIGVSGALESAPPASAVPPYSVDDALKDVDFDKPKFEEILGLWRTKKNVILQGPPGVGKTFLARRLAYTLIGHEQPSRVCLIQFHQSYSYEDFVQGYRPVENGFARKDGVFVRFCKQASLGQNFTYVFIIDEINRSNLSKVFGELLMLIEADKRGSKNSLELTYSTSGDEQFYVPPNVYVLGLMNTADRSLALVDYALRRRFAFVDLEPLFGSETFVEFLVRRGAEREFAKIVVARMEALNRTIAEEQTLGPGYRIGHSYFCGTDALVEEAYLQTIRHEILPLLKEYWFDSPEKVAEWTKKLEAKFTHA